MSLAHKKSGPQDKSSSVNPAENTKKKSTQVQNPNDNQVSSHGNTTDGNDAGHGVNKIRSNPQGNNPMSVNKGKVGKGGDAKH
ncbi:hypothetical protein [Hymenobacter psoromatis]|uniref:hypothetical protein n=1 Tax=Hymenobacter psoromatis TaxID=1484116 RepID=UPI001CC103EB|nr:hypothetical protein [Hymenobacter psoromatis]